MKRCWGILVGLCIMIGAQGQSTMMDDLVASSSHQLSQEVIQQKISSFTQSLQKEQLSEEDLLRKVFKKSHHVFLKKYQPYAQFNEVVEKHHYDCLSATALFSIILNDLHFTYKIIETNYHIFLIVRTSNGKDILLETTDRFDGFVSDEGKINARLAGYQQNPGTPDSKNVYLYHFNLYREVQPQQLTGLLIFNQAVIAFNNHRWMECYLKLKESAAKYETERIAELAFVLTQSVQLSSNLSEDDKKIILQGCAPYVRTKPTVALR